jgi:hypothetical protein
MNNRIKAAVLGVALAAGATVFLAQPASASFNSSPRGTGCTFDQSGGNGHMTVFSFSASGGLNRCNGANFEVASAVASFGNPVHHWLLFSQPGCKGSGPSIAPDGDGVDETPFVMHSYELI